MNASRKLTRLSVVIAALAVLFALAPDRAHATVITFDLDTSLSGTPPLGAAPWLRATIDDGGGSGSVTLKMEDLNLTGGEIVRTWHFNLDPSFDPTLLSASAGTVTAGAMTVPTPSFGLNAFASLGAGSSDIQFAFATSGNASKKFGAGEGVSYVLTLAGITASSFNFADTGGTMLTAAEANGGGWIGFPVPEPSSLALLGIGVLTFLAGGWRRRTRLG